MNGAGKAGLTICRQWIGILLCSCLRALPSQFLSQLCNLKLQFLHLLNQINRFCHFFSKFQQGGMQLAAKTAIFKVIHSSMQLWSKLLMCYTGTNAKTSKTKTPKTKCKVLFNLKYYNLINYNWNYCYKQKYTKVISTKLSPKCCQHTARYMLFLWGVVLQCTWVLCCGVQCCMLRSIAHSYCKCYSPQLYSYYPNIIIVYHYFQSQKN